MSRPRLVAFDLDGTIWLPEMYELWGGGPPFKGNGHAEIHDRKGVPIRLLGASRAVLSDLKNNSAWSGTKVAWVSCTDEPEWAHTLLNSFKLTCGEPLSSAIHSSQIFKANKREHFRRLKAEFPDISFEDMLFFDNESSNISNVSSLGVKCVYCPDGVTHEIWEEGLRLFGASSVL